MNTKLRFALSALVVMSVATGSAIYYRGLRLPSPVVILDLYFRWTPLSQSHKNFSNVYLRPSSDPTPIRTKRNPPIPVSAPWHGGEIEIQELLEATNTRAFIVLHDGEIAWESYYSGYSKETLFSSYSVAKAVVATLTGAALFDGRLKSLQDPIGKYFRDGEIAEDYRSITVADLLAMRSGIDVEERHDSITSRLVSMYLSTDLSHFVSNLSGLRYAPGTRFEYRSIDTLILGQALSRATGMSLSEFTVEKLWEPLGMVYEATWSVDSLERKTEKAFCCLNATARDFAKLGLLYLAAGKAGTKQIVSEQWARSPSLQINRTGKMQYADGWWIPPDNSRDRDFCAIGIYGQYIYVNPTARTVIVKLSEHGAEQDEMSTIAALRHISRIVAGMP